MNLSMSLVVSSMSSRSGILCPPSWKDTKILFLGTCVAALRQVAWKDRVASRSSLILGAWIPMIMPLLPMAMHQPSVTIGLVSRFDTPPHISVHFDPFGPSL